MNPPELPADWQTPPSSPKKELQLRGPHPTPLKVSQDSHKIKKPPLPPSAVAVHHHAALSETTKQTQRYPVFINEPPPKVITVRTASDFKDLVQRLTGLPPGDEPAAGSGDVLPSARQASIEKTSPSKRERVVKSKSREESVKLGQSNEIVQWYNVHIRLRPPWAPATLPPISSDDFLQSPSGLPPGILSPPPVPITPTQPSPSRLVSDSMVPPQP